MYHRHNGHPDGRYSVCTIEAILVKCFTALVFCGLSCFLHHFLTLPTLWKEMGIAEKEKSLPDCDIDILSTFFFFLPTAEIIARLTDKIGMHIPAGGGGGC